MHRYILDEDGNPKPEPDLMAWGRFFENHEARIVERTTIGDKQVSTVFLGTDHGIGVGPPILWETMVFPGGSDCERYTSREAAVKGHAEVCERIRREVT